MSKKTGVLCSLAIVTMLSFTNVAYAASLPMTGSQWAVLELSGSKLLTTHATTISSGGVQFTFPSATGTPAVFANLMSDRFNAKLTEANVLTATFQVTGSATFLGNPDGGCPGSSSSLCPGDVRLFFQSHLATVSSQITNGCPVSGVNEYNYWWSNDGTTGTYYQLTSAPSSGTVTLTVQLAPANWSDWCGHSGLSNPAKFDSAIGSVKLVGLSFGSGYFFENGVGIDGSTGSATFQLLSYTIT